MNRPTVVVLDKDFHVVADLSEWVDDLQKSYSWVDPKTHKDNFGFTNQARPQCSRTATVEFRHHPVSEKIIACRNEKVYGAFVIDGRLSRWEMTYVGVLGTGRWTIRFTEMNPYTESLLREVMAVGTKHLTKQENPEPIAPVEVTLKSKKRSRK